MSAEASIFSNKVRVRVCGLLVQKGNVLLIKHEGIGPKGFLWAPPGGGVNFGESLELALKREFLEETGLEISIARLLFINEHIDHLHHAIEFFYEVKKTGGQPAPGHDPELPLNDQIIKELSFISADSIEAMDKSTLHRIFKNENNPNALINRKSDSPIFSD